MTFLDKELVIALYEKDHSYSKVARKFNTSRQRIHQIVTGYGNTGRWGREEKYKSKPQVCEFCGKSPIYLHHIDGNNFNENIINLLAVCRHCHIRLHIGKKKKKY